MHVLSGIRVAIQQCQKAHGFALLHQLAGHLEHDHPAGRMPGKVIGAGGLNRTHLLHIVRCEFTYLRLMLVDIRGELETIHGLFPA